MDKIASFCIDHDKLVPGIYLSRIDGDVKTYDIRMRRPNTPPYLENAALHTLEHLFATFARNSEWKDHVIYFGPMGCRTGFYLVTIGLSEDAVCRLLQETIALSLSMESVPGASEESCGNYRDLDLRDGVEALQAFLPKCVKRAYKPL